MVNNEVISEVISILREEYKKWKIPIVTQYANDSNNPFKVLISTILSLRTKDKVTQDASEKLFNIANNPELMASLDEDKIGELIYPVGFWKTKASNIKEISTRIVNDYNGKVPDSIDELLKFKGVGRKTANLVVILGYDKLGICVDTHMHRIFNRWGYVQTKTPDRTEFDLRKKLPIEYWKEINNLLVAYGQNLCKPISPFCSKCKLATFCEKKGVTNSR